ncbi:hypothetical protein [Microbulbifer sp. GL-2]|uniref:hypothetical protein n=1 Tax=Microbulbifer sp. GL-2 TaxID=2591606 RepID=UPI00116551F8|nr:hypothetical protein [Microbulbifer sp. GL-2]BBM01243.1 hypothetical protein GL2_13170 [Microbulbifer sp. GL-2]
MEKKEQASITESTSGDRAPLSSRKFQGVSIMASVLLPMVAAYIVFYTGMGVPSGTINQGNLLQPPVKINELKINYQGEETNLLSNTSPKWRYLILSESGCKEECEKLLYTSRQVHIRLGEKANRVERLLITGAPMPVDKQEKIKIEHPRLKILELSEENIRTLQELTAHQDVAAVRAILIDQEGFAMMAYDNHHSGNQLLKDIKRLLKYSYEK